MRILLLGEYSNVHATLAEGLRCLGHEVTVVSNGDFWKNYPRDIDMARPAGRLGGLRLLARTWRILPRLRGYDVVQLINPLFLELKAERLFAVYRFLRRNNGRVFLGAFGMDHYWVHENITRKPLRYSDFNIGEKLRTQADAMREQTDWLGTTKEKLNRRIADDCDGIVAGLYEYWVCYHPCYPGKTTFIPFPIHPPKDIKPAHAPFKLPIKIFVGISKNRSAYKGTDIMLEAAKKLKEKYNDLIDLHIAEGVPFEQYCQLMQDADLILDQLYSYTPAMNALEAMRRGVICVGGGEPENYDILHETELRPIINVKPSFNSVFHELEKLVLHPERIPLLKSQSQEYICRHHDYIKVARLYLDFYQSNG